MDTNIYTHLLKRIEEPHLAKRLIRQVTLAANFYSKTSPAPFHFENVQWIHVVLKALLKITGLYNKGMMNAIDYSLERINVPIKNLPPLFNGFKILQISDIHADALLDRGERLKKILRGITADICVFTGDFRFMTQNVHAKALAMTMEIGDCMGEDCPKFGILGNHDFIEFVPSLESGGIQMLLNEAVPIEKNGTRIWLAGIDDAHLYRCHDIEKALAKIPAGAVKIMLSHTPETYAEASTAGVDYLLCGHTHGGQICLPGGITLMTNAKCPKNYCKGSWNHKGMHGYTSRGTGSSGVPVRFFCPPEITVHELVCAGHKVLDGGVKK
ncbi:metallophosphoesterase [Desulfocicer niacini]